MTPPRTIAIARNYDEFHAALRLRADQLGVTREGLDETMKTLPDGYASKLLAPVPIKTLGPISMGPMLAALGLMILVVEDVETLKKLSGKRAKRVKRQENTGDADEPMPTSKRRKNRHKWKSGNSAWGRMMRARCTILTPDSKRRKSAQWAAQARWKKGQAKRQSDPAGSTPSTASQSQEG